MYIPRKNLSILYWLFNDLYLMMVSICSPIWNIVSNRNIASASSCASDTPEKWRVFWVFLVKIATKFHLLNSPLHMHLYSIHVPLNPRLIVRGRKSFFQTKGLSVSLKCNLPEKNVCSNTLNIERKKKCIKLYSKIINDKLVSICWFVWCNYDFSH